jgi:hypothetical protein
MKFNKFGLIFLFALGMGSMSSAMATLYTRPGGMVYDSDLNLTWLANANFAGGSMDWQTANHWAENLVYAGYSDWRLPAIEPINGYFYQYVIQWYGSYGVILNTNDGSSDMGYSITSPNSELSYMFYQNLHNLGNCTPSTIKTDCVYQTGWGLNNVGPFMNIQPWGYWSSSTPGANTENAWLFNFYVGAQFLYQKSDQNYAWAVRSGDVSAVPEPDMRLLLGTGLGAWMGSKYWRKGRIKNAVRRIRNAVRRIRRAVGRNSEAM